MVRNCLKAVAIALIVFPEPLSTALGIALLSAALALPGRKRLDSFGDMDDLVKRSLKKGDPPEFGRGASGNRTIVFHKLKSSLVSQSVIATNRADKSEGSQKNIPAKTPKSADLNPNIALLYTVVPEKGGSAFQSVNWFDNRKVPEKVLHHTLRTSLPQYEALPDNVQTSTVRPVGPGKAPAVKFHAPNKLTPGFEGRNSSPLTEKTRLKNRTGIAAIQQ
jgi:hypothetical protein